MQLSASHNLTSVIHRRNKSNLFLSRIIVHLKQSFQQRITLKVLGHINIDSPGMLVVLAVVIITHYRIFRLICVNIACCICYIMMPSNDYRLRENIFNYKEYNVMQRLRVLSIIRILFSSLSVEEGISEIVKNILFNKIKLHFICFSLSSLRLI